LNEIPDESRHVAATRGENEVIHLVDVGADPEVIINNTTYPIGFSEQEDKDIAITLDNYTTKATRVTDQEIQYIAYDKIRLVQEKHALRIMETKHHKAVHALGASQQTTNTPILVTTGEDDGTGRRRCTNKDIINHAAQYNGLKIPFAGRNLVLNAQHYADLLYECELLKKSDGHLSYSETGMLKERLHGFKTWLYLDMPYYNLSSLQKKPFGSVVEAGDMMGTVSFYARDMFRASGMTKNYADEPTTQNHAWLYNAKHNYVVLPRKERAHGAVISADV
ncbi:hypothetical protein, partial [Aquimarina latercula]|uniref:hypothetical protein n=1 Tax=Aquimarina latercula TaxID=987 RepID=UPI000481E213